MTSVNGCSSVSSTTSGLSPGFSKTGDNLNTCSDSLPVGQLSPTESAPAMTSPAATELTGKQLQQLLEPPPYTPTYTIINNSLSSPTGSDSASLSQRPAQPQVSYCNGMPLLTSLNNNSTAAMTVTNFKPQFAAPLLYHAIKSVADASDATATTGGSASGNSSVSTLSPIATNSSPMSILSSSGGDPSPEMHAHAAQNEAFCYTPSPSSASALPVRATSMTSQHQVIMNCSSVASGAFQQVPSAFVPAHNSRQPPQQQPQQHLAQQSCVPISPVIQQQQQQQFRFNPPPMQANGCRLTSNYPAYDPSNLANQHHLQQQQHLPVNNGYLRMINGALPPPSDPNALPIMPRPHTWAQELEIDVNAPTPSFASGKIMAAHTRSGLRLAASRQSRVLS